MAAQLTKQVRTMFYVIRFYKSPGAEYVLGAHQARLSGTYGWRGSTTATMHDLCTY